MKNICLVSCVGSKVNFSTEARNLYISPLFIKSKTLASTQFDNWYILSAKYGLVDPDKKINPYDLTLKDLNIEDRKKWAKTVYKDLIKEIPLNCRITFLAGFKYREFLVPMLERSGYKTSVPMNGLSIGMQLSWLNRANYQHQSMVYLKRFYELIERLRVGLGGFREFKNCTGKLYWPARGVYFIFEDDEMRNTGEGVNRVVRVGTHAVSRNSKATFWHRLSTHKGTRNGFGNHRSSVFRLHIGNAILKKNPGKFNASNWGEGQSSDEVTRSSEIALEKAVSDIISNMKLLWISVGDEPSPKSDRSYIEKNTIGLLTSIIPPIDPPSESWLGLYSNRKRIRESGLWNLDYNKYIYDPMFLDIFEKYVDSTIGKSEQIVKSIAPANWYKEKRSIAAKQLKLFED